MNSYPALEVFARLTKSTNKVFGMVATEITGPRIRKTHVQNPFQAGFLQTLNFQVPSPEYRICFFIARVEARSLLQIANGLALENDRGHYFERRGHQTQKLGGGFPLAYYLGGDLNLPLRTSMKLPLVLFQGSALAGRKQRRSTVEG